MELVISLYPGIDMLGQGFEAEGFCIVRDPDRLWGGNIHNYHVPAGKFDGVIGGPPCQLFSTENRTHRDPVKGMELVNEFLRVVEEASPAWFLIENIKSIPDITPPPGYTVQRFDLNALECGLMQSRLRHFQFGSKAGLTLIPERLPKPRLSQKICLASEGKRTDRRSFADFCELQGLPRTFSLPGWSLSAKYTAVGNGVPVPMARTVARAIRAALDNPVVNVRLCACNCGRIVTGKQISATPACRKRLEKRRKQAQV